MKTKMKSLEHKGILVLPEYKACGYFIIVNGKDYIKLNDKQEEMAFHWVKKLNTPYIEDPIFRKNFFQDFCKELGIDFTEDITFEQLIWAYERQKWNKEHMSKEDKKKAREKRKKLREERRKKFGIALVDGKEVEVSNYIAEPSSIFIGRGKHPLKGHWKEGPREEDIILNLSPDAPRPPGNWKEIVWRPNRMWIASWKDKLSGKTKYVWLADSWVKKQKKEKLKFDRALEMGNVLGVIYNVILNGLNDEEDTIRKVASVCYLIYKTNMRVGDEKDPGEADTVGAITLRPEHVTIKRKTRKAFSDTYEVYLDFLGKDSVRWRKVIHLADPRFVKNLERFKRKGRAFFEGISSKDVSKFLRRAYPYATAKMFRTYRATKAMKDALRHPRRLIFERPDLFNEKQKKLYIKLCILEGSKICNHKKALPKNYEERLAKKQDKVNRLLEKQVQNSNKLINRKKEKKRTNDLKKAKKLSRRIGEAKLELEFFKETSGWNLNTTLKSYIDPRVVKSACDKVNLPYDKVYSKTLLRKFSWVFDEDSYLLKGNTLN